MDTPNMPSSMPSQITSSEQKSNSQTMLLIGGLVLIIVLGGVYYLYQYNKDMAALPQEEVKASDSDSSLNSLEAEINAESTGGVDVELEAMDKELTPQ